MKHARQCLFVVLILNKSFCAVLMPNTADSGAFSFAMYKKMEASLRSYIYRLVCRQLEHTQISNVPAEASDQIYAAKFKDEIPRAVNLALNF